MHDGHRERFRERVRNTGVENLEDHELLEYLLYQTYKRENTNEIAHELLKHFGSFDKVLDAGEEALMAVSGVGEVTAQFLSILPQVFAVYEKRRRGGGNRFVSLGSIVEWLTPFYYGTNVETGVFLCFDADYNLLHEEVCKKGSATELPISIREVVAIALQYDTAKLVFSHSHLTNVSKPSLDDVMLTNELRMALGAVKIELLDHVILCPNGNYYSFKEEKSL